jgi:hypothetical protein
MLDDDTQQDGWCLDGEASRLLWDEYRIKRNPRRLGQLRATGKGPLYHRDGQVVRYRKSDLRSWAEAQLGEGIRSTSEECARRLLERATYAPANEATYDSNHRGPQGRGRPVSCTAHSSEPDKRSPRITPARKLSGGSC